MRKGYSNYIADDGKHFVLTEKAKESATFKHYEVGKPYDDWEHYIPYRFVDEGIFEEVEDPDWVVLPGFKVVRDYKGTMLQCGNPHVFHDKEMAERYRENYEKLYKSWGDDYIPYLIEAVYEGKKPVPNKIYKGKRVFVRDNWYGDVEKVGDLVEEKIVMDIANCVPPKTYQTGFVQCGEPYNSAKEGETYATFIKIDDDVWEFKGNCLKGHTEEDWTPIPQI